MVESVVYYTLTCPDRDINKSMEGKLNQVIKKCTKVGKPKSSFEDIDSLHDYVQISTKDQSRSVHKQALVTIRSKYHQELFGTVTVTKSGMPLILFRCPRQPPSCWIRHHQSPGSLRVQTLHLIIHRTTHRLKRMAQQELLF
ncbi:hypothetical protein ElyMa_005434900 [Elysia marginata]|uniref:Uncharacterized protein n=1 Tax=Elysia marginata TaxID=1093978 RepID=A0AAV4ELE6_9GAST|nr:hypothetical protein ElyMa_005434900 [Elysia marginata]